MTSALNWRVRLLPCFVGLMLLLTGCDQHQQAAAPAPKPAVSVRPVALKGIAQSFEFVGHVSAIYKVDIRARIEGFLDKLLFREGQEVKAGDLLYQIEKIQYQAQVEQARANLASAEAQVVNAQVQYNRKVQLAQDRWAPQSDVDQYKATLDSDKAKVLQTRAALTLADVNLGYTDVWSPIDGKIGRTVYQIGNLVNPASGVLVTIVSQDPMYVQFPISVRDLQIIRDARRQESGGLAKIEIRVRLSNGQEYPQRGVWNLNDPQVDQRTDTLMMRAIIPNPDRQLIDGQFVTAVIRERTEKPQLVIPQAALQTDQTGYYVLVVDDQHKVAERRVQTGRNRDTEVAVTAGLHEGERVIVDGVQKVRPGQVVQDTVLAAAAGDQQ